MGLGSDRFWVLYLFLEPGFKHFFLFFLEVYIPLELGFDLFEFYISDLFGVEAESMEPVKMIGADGNNVGQTVDPLPFARRWFLIFFFLIGASLYFHCLVAGKMQERKRKKEDERLFSFLDNGLGL